MATSLLRDECQIPKGQVIFRQGDPGNEMFVIETGKVRLTVESEGHEKEVAVLLGGEFFGELSLLGNAPRSATAQALEDSLLLAIGRDVFNVMVQDDLRIVYRMMSIQGQRLVKSNVPIQQLTTQLGHVRIATHCLRRLRQPGTQWPATLDVRALAGTLGLGVDAVETTLADLARRGVGVLVDNHWTVADAAGIERLIETVCDYADGI